MLVLINLLLANSDRYVFFSFFHFIGKYLIFGGYSDRQRFASFIFILCDCMAYDKFVLWIKIWIVIQLHLFICIACNAFHLAMGFAAIGMVCVVRSARGREDLLGNWSGFCHLEKLRIFNRVWSNFRPDCWDWMWLGMRNHWLPSAFRRIVAWNWQ